MLCSRATSRIRVTVGPSSGSAVAYHLGSCSAGKYGPWKISCRQVTCAPSAAAFPISSTCLSMASCLDMLALHWITAARTVVIKPSSHQRGDELLSERSDHRFRIVDHGVEVELIDTNLLQLS